MTDKQLYELCQKYGSEARKWKNKFVSLLPEVYKRRLYRKRRFCSIYEFAAKLGGISKNVVKDVLRLNEKLKEMPEIKKLIPEIGVSKLKVVACIAKKETDSFWAEKVSTMTRAGLETYIRDIKKIPGDKKNTSDLSLFDKKILGDEDNMTSNLSLFDKNFPGENSSQNTNLLLFDEQNEVSENQNLKAQNKVKSIFPMKLSEEAIFNLQLIKLKIEKEQGKVLCWDEVINLTAEKLLKDQPKREYKTRESKSRSKSRSKTHPSKSRSKTRSKSHSSKSHLSKSRPIPAKKRREQSKKCVVLGCNKPATVIHHPDRWILTKSHENLKPMCKPHHELAHRGFIDEQNDFKTLIKPMIDPIKAAIDQKMLGRLKGT